MRAPEADRRARRLTRYLIGLAGINGVATALLARAAEAELAWFTAIAGVVMLAGAVAASRAAEDELERDDDEITVRHRTVQVRDKAGRVYEVRATSEDDEIHP